MPAKSAASSAVASAAYFVAAPASLPERELWCRTAELDAWAAGQGGYHWLLIRRNHKNGEYAFYRAWSPTEVPISALVRAAGRRWTIEESFAAGKELAARPVR